VSDSIFLPLPLIRNSERADYKTCPAKWNWRWNMGLVPKMTKQDARWFGSIWHLLWATVYTPPGKDGFERAIIKTTEIHQLWDELSKDAYTTVSSAGYFDDDKEREFWDAIKLGHFMIDGQINKWRARPRLRSSDSGATFQRENPVQSSPASASRISLAATGIPPWQPVWRAYRPRCRHVRLAGARPLRWTRQGMDLGLEIHQS
jgi:hypothetical protein